LFPGAPVAPLATGPYNARMREWKGAERVEAVGGRLAMAGVFGFAALCTVSIALSQICIGVVVLGLAVAFGSGRRRYRPTGLEPAIALFLGVEILAALLARDRRWSIPALEDDWPLLLVPIFSQALGGARDARRALRVFMASAAVASLLALWETFSGWDPIRDHALDPVGRLFVAGAFFGQHLTWGGIVLLAATLAVVELAAAASPFSILRAALLVLGLAASFARTAWVGFAGALVGFAIAARGRIRTAAAAALVAGAAAAIAVAPIRLRLGAFLAFHDDPRLRLWRTALRIWRDRPLLGAGPGSFPHLFEQYKVPGHYMATGHPHNDFLKVLANAGVIGFAAFTFLWVRYFGLVGTAYGRLAPQDPRRSLLLGGLLGVAAFLLGATGQCFLSDETVADVFWFFAASALVVAREVRSGPPGR
jgi:O-antigen ligase